MAKYHFTISAASAYNTFRRDVGSDRLQDTSIQTGTNRGTYGLALIGNTMWVNRGNDETIRAYNLLTGARDASQDYPFGVGNKYGIFAESDGMWICTNAANAISKYPRQGVPIATLGTDSGFNPVAVAASSSHYYVLAYNNQTVRAYHKGSLGQDTSKNITLDSTTHASAVDMWIDGDYLYIPAELGSGSTIFCYNITTGNRDTSKEFNYATLTGFTTGSNPIIARPNGICMNENTIWIGDQNNGAASENNRQHKIFGFARAGVKQGLFVPRNDANATNYSLGVDVPDFNYTEKINFLAGNSASDADTAHFQQSTGRVWVNDSTNNAGIDDMIADAAAGNVYYRISVEVVGSPSANFVTAGSITGILVQDTTGIVSDRSFRVADAAAMRGVFGNQTTSGTEWHGNNRWKFERITTYTELGRWSDGNHDNANQADWVNFVGGSFCASTNPSQGSNPFPLQFNSTTYRLRYVPGGAATAPAAEIVGQAVSNPHTSSTSYCVIITSSAAMITAFGAPVSNPNSPPSFNGGTWILEILINTAATGYSWQQRSALAADKNVLGFESVGANRGWEWTKKTS